MSLDVIAKRISKVRVYPDVNDFTDRGLDEVSDIKKDAQRAAKAISFKPLMHVRMAGDDGKFAFIPDDLIMVAGDAFYVDNFDDDHVFELEHVRSQASVDKLKEDLAIANRDWSFDEIIDSVWSDKNGAVIRSLNEKGKTSGVFAVRRNVSVDIYDGNTVFSYAIVPELIYVSKKERGNSISTALRRAIMDSVHEDVDRIEKTWNSGKMQSIMPIKLQFKVAGEAFSDLGDEFCSKLSSNLDECVENRFSNEQVKSDFLYGDRVLFDVEY